VTAALAALALQLTLGSAGAVALDARAYQAQLASLEERLLARDRSGAAAQARALLESRVDFGAETLVADRYVLERIADPAQKGVVAPLHALLASLAAPPLDGAAPAVDRQALSALALRQAERAASGALGGLSLRTPSVSETLTRWLKAATGWLLDRLRDLGRWLRKWFALHPPTPSPENNSGLVTLVLLGAGLLLMTALLAALLSQRKREPAPQQTALAPPPDADKDPLSRTASEWEQRARALAGAGQFREAIRAWYHALLVSCYRAGVLHHQTGRTNREYAQALAADVPWRGRFEELTGRFDVEWYGRAQSSPEVLDAFAGEADAILGALGRTPP
jgi:hypothetical protein